MFKIKNKLSFLLLLIVLVSCNDKTIDVDSGFKIETKGHEFSCNLTLLYSKEDPDLQLRPAGIKNIIYGVASWKAIAGDDLLKQVEMDETHLGDGFDEKMLTAKTKNRTANLFHAGINIKLSPERIEEKGDTTIIIYQENKYAQVVAKVFMEEGQLCFKAEMKPLKDGYFSIAYMNAPSSALKETDEIWQPMIWQEKRFPEKPYMTLAFRTPIPSTLATFDNNTYGVVAHPDEFPFQPLPLRNNNRFGIAVRNKKGEVQPMLFAPVLGGVESKMSVGERFNFKAVLFAGEGSCSDIYESIARQLYGFKDYRKNDIGTLNETFENMVEYIMSDYSWFVDSLKGCAYSTDVPGAVKNVSSLNPLELALVTDSKSLFDKRAYPIMEYQISREKFLFSMDKNQKNQAPARKLLGPIAPVSELTSLYNIFGQNMPFLMNLADEAYNSRRIRNLKVMEEGNTWMNSMFMFKASGDSAYLHKATAEADEYINQRIKTPQTDFDDPLAGGFFFWTGFAPRWIHLLELYELTGKERYLEAAHQGARQYTMFTWMCPKIPNDSITVNKGGKAPLYSYLKTKGHKQMYIDEEKAPAWRLSEIGLTPESSGTCGGHRGIFMANYAPWMLRLGHYTNDDFLKDVAKAAIVGRYLNFPGYHINTARTTIYEKEDYPLRPYKELSVNSFHHNHIMPMASMVLDYLVTDAFSRSEGQINFPSDFIEGYAYMQNKFYGHKKGQWYGQDAWLWMPPKLVESASVELNYISARNGDKLFIALSNQSPEKVRTKVKINKNLVKCKETTSVQLMNNKKLDIKDSELEVEIPAHGQVAVIIKHVDLNVKIQDELLNQAKTWSNDFIMIETGHAKAMIFNCGRVNSNLYLYLEDDDENCSEVTLTVKQNNKESVYADTDFPFEFTVPLTGNQVEFKLTVIDHAGKKHESEWKKLNK